MSAISVLIDPDLTAFATTHPDKLDQLAPDAELELAAEIGTRLEPYADNLTYGPLTQEMVDILCGAFTADTWRQRQADLVAHFLTSRVSIDRSLRPTPADLQASDWTAAAATAPVRIWLTAGNESIDTAFRDAGLNVTLTTWGPAPWIQSPDELSTAIETTADSTSPDNLIASRPAYGHSCESDGVSHAALNHRRTFVTNLWKRR